MMDYLKVEGNESLVRDVQSQAIINTNNKDYENYIKRKKIVGHKSEQINSQAEEINNLKAEMSEIKLMLIELLKGK